MLNSRFSISHFYWFFLFCSINLLHTPVFASDEPEDKTVLNLDSVASTWKSYFFIGTQAIVLNQKDDIYASQYDLYGGGKLKEYTTCSMVSSCLAPKLGFSILKDFADTSFSFGLEFAYEQDVVKFEYETASRAKLPVQQSKRTYLYESLLIGMHDGNQFYRFYFNIGAYQQLQPNDFIFVGEALKFNSQFIGLVALIPIDNAGYNYFRIDYQINLGDYRKSLSPSASGSNYNTNKFTVEKESIQFLFQFEM
ncbi:MAG: hypothetical protein QM538_05735 [Methylacidiphilales bacterium]|nr:hypothetical protein [Candidatus Methylacidiphilales bacterium]